MANQSIYNAFNRFWQHVTTKLGDYATKEYSSNANNITSGTIPITRGGTGATTATGALTNLGLTATATELNYCDGVTSNVQTQLNNLVAADSALSSSIDTVNNSLSNEISQLSAKITNYHKFTWFTPGITSNGYVLTPGRVYGISPIGEIRRNELLNNFSAGSDTILHFNESGIYMFHVKICTTYNGGNTPASTTSWLDFYNHTTKVVNCNSHAEGNCPEFTFIAIVNSSNEYQLRFSIQAAVNIWCEPKSAYVLIQKLG